MSNKVFISCAVTGSGDTAGKHPDLPKTPEQIAKASIEAAKAGAAIAHIHVREEDGTPSRRLDLYRQNTIKWHRCSTKFNYWYWRRLRYWTRKKSFRIWTNDRYG